MRTRAAAGRLPAQVFRASPDRSRGDRGLVFYKYEYDCELCGHLWLTTHMLLEPAACPRCGNRDAMKVAWRELRPEERRRAPTTERGRRGRL